jgi:hypothetical protein
MFSSSKGPMAFLLRLLVFLVIFAGIGEVWFRTVTPGCESPTYYQDTVWNIRRHDPGGPTEGLWTVGRLAARGGHWRVNNDGWISAQDYLPAAERDRPLVGLLGDSLLQGFFADVDQHVDTYLSSALGGEADVYTFAAGGWYLEQYVAVSRYVGEAYAPDVLVIFIDNHDVHDSVRDYGVLSTYMWQIASSGTGFDEVAPTGEYVASRLAAPVRRIALLNYLRYNAGVSLPGMAGATTAQDMDGDDGGGAGTQSADAWRELVPAAEYMVGLLHDEHPGVPIVFAAYGEKYLSVDQIAGTPLYADALAVQQACQGISDCYFLDLREAFSRDWAANHIRLEAADGDHWNARADEVVAGAVAALIRQQGLIGGRSRSSNRPRAR